MYAEGMLVNRKKNNPNDKSMVWNMHMNRKQTKLLFTHSPMFHSYIFIFLVYVIYKIDGNELNPIVPWVVCVRERRNTPCG